MGQNHSTRFKSSCYLLPKLDMDYVAFDYGEIVKMHEGSDRFRVEWQIPNFLSLRKEISDCFISPVFTFLLSECHLVVVPFDDSDAEKWYKMYVYWMRLERPVTYTLGIKQVDGTIDNVGSFSDEAREGCSVSGQDKFLKRDVLLKRYFMLLSSGTLTVTLTAVSQLEGQAAAEDDSEIECVFDSRTAKDKALEVICLSSDDSDTEGDQRDKALEVICLSSDDSDTEGDQRGSTFVSRSTQTEDLCAEEETEHKRLEAKIIFKLTAQLGNMLLEGQDHDVIIDVKNRKFKAHKDVLRARSPVFASMFQHDMQEKSNNSVSIFDCEPHVFEEFLKHVYTGKAKIDSVKSAIVLYYTGDKYDFQDLKEQCVLYLNESLETTTVCDVIKMATVHGEADLLQRASSFFAENMEEILQTAEWQRFLRSNVTTGNELLIQAVKQRSQKSVQKPSV